MILLNSIHAAISAGANTVANNVDAVAKFIDQVAR